eukprot:5458787-Pleurochrysis_carterae.AAC.1
MRAFTLEHAVLDGSEGERGVISYRKAAQASTAKKGERRSGAEVREAPRRALLWLPGRNDGASEAPIAPACRCHVRMGIGAHGISVGYLLDICLILLDIWSMLVGCLLDRIDIRHIPDSSGYMGMNSSF